MLLEITKKEMIEITLSKVLYTKYGNGLYYRYTPKDGNIEVLQFSCQDNFNLLARVGLWENDIEQINLTGKYTLEITEDEFNTKLQELLLKHI